MRQTTVIATGVSVVLVGSGLIAASPASAASCDSWIVSPNPGLATAAEVDQLREGMSLQQVETLFGSPGAITWSSESTYGKSMDVTWVGATSLMRWYGSSLTSEVEVSFSMEKATTQTSYGRKKIKVKNVKRAKRLGLPRWKWKTVRVVTPVPATPFTVESFYVYSADILRQQRRLECSSY